MQLESGRRLRAHVCVKQIYSLDGLRGFYRGLSASYAGTCETAIHFVIYEHIKKLIRRRKSELDLLDCMGAAAVAKFTASSICYPHGKEITQYLYKLCYDSYLIWPHRGGENPAASEGVQGPAQIPFLFPDYVEGLPRRRPEGVVWWNECPLGQSGAQHCHCLLHI